MSAPTNFHVTGNPLFSLFPIEKAKFPNLTCRKLGQGHSMVIILRNYGGLESWVRHTKFRGNQPAGSGEEVFLRVYNIYGRGGHLGHVTSIKSSDLHCLVPGSFHTKFGSDQHSSD